VREFPRRVDVLPWDRESAARAIGAVLVTSDRAFAGIPGLAVEDWTA